MQAPRVNGPPGERGFAMVAVLLVLALIGLLGAEFAYSMRLEARAARNYKDAVMAGHLAEAALENAIREIVGQGTLVAEAEDGELTFYTRDRVALKRLPRENVPLGDGQYSYRITDEAARFNVNTIEPARLDRLLQLLDVDKQERDTIVDSIRDWIDENDEHRANGAESDDYYLKLPVPYRARNGPLESVSELLQIKGITPALFHGTPEKPGLADLVTVFGQGSGQHQYRQQAGAPGAGLGRRRGPRVPGHASRGSLRQRPRTRRRSEIGRHHADVPDRGDGHSRRQAARAAHRHRGDGGRPHPSRRARVELVGHSVSGPPRCRTHREQCKMAGRTPRGRNLTP